MGFGAVKLQPAMAQASRPLAGRRIVVTRAREQAGDLAQALAPLRAAVADLTRYQWIVFTSQNTVRVVCDRLPEWGVSPQALTGIPVAAIGPATAEALAQRGVTATLVP